MMHSAILLSAAVLVPTQARQEWLDEWRSELWYVRATCSYGKALLFCLGAFRDALWVRHNCAGVDESKTSWLQSPIRCVLLLAVLASITVLFAFRLDGVRNTILPSPYRDARTLVMISPGDPSATQSPGFSFAAFQSLKRRGTDRFSRLAFYNQVPLQVGSAELSIAYASADLFELLGVPFSSSDGRPILILNQSAWNKYFDRDPHVVGRLLEIGGQPTRIGGILSPQQWQLPGQFDGWLLTNEPQLASTKAPGPGFVVARLRESPLHKQPRWHVWISSDRFLCSSLGWKQPILPHIFMILGAFLLLPVTTSLSLGEYPEGRNSPPLTTRLRRWLLLAAKITLLILIVLFGSLDLAAVSPIQPHGLLVGYVLAFRWALIDQRNRCPVCLRSLSNPIRVGWSSQTFLEWYGTELICRKGHGLLHVPEIPSSCYGIQRWYYLDRSWTSLFVRNGAEPGGVH